MVTHCRDGRASSSESELRPRLESTSCGSTARKDCLVDNEVPDEPVEAGSNEKRKRGPSTTNATARRGKKKP